MERVEPQAIGQIISQVLAQEGLERPMREQQACAAWPRIVGEGINRYTVRRYVRNSVLHVHITSAPLKQELSFHRDRLLEALNLAAGVPGTILDVRFH